MYEQQLRKLQSKLRRIKRESSYKAVAALRRKCVALHRQSENKNKHMQRMYKMIWENSDRNEKFHQTLSELLSTSAQVRRELSKSRESVRQLKHIVNMWKGHNLHEANDQALDRLRIELQQTLTRVQDWQDARNIVAQEFPDLCCAIETTLMHDPAMTADGRTFERTAIMQYFEMLKKQKEPMQTPFRQLLPSTTLISNYTVKNLITSLVEQKFSELQKGKASEELQ
jgi:hypothetical protein